MGLKEHLKSLPWINITKLEQACGLKRNIIQLYDSGRGIPKCHEEVIWKELSKASQAYNELPKQLTAPRIASAPKVEPIPLKEEVIEKPIVDDADPDELIEFKLFKDKAGFAMLMASNVKPNAIVTVNDIDYTIKKCYLIGEDREEPSCMFVSGMVGYVKRKYVVDSQHTFSF